MPGAELLQANAWEPSWSKFLKPHTYLEKSLLIVVLALAAAFIFMFTKIRWSLIHSGDADAGTQLPQNRFSMPGAPGSCPPYLTVVITFVAVYMYRYLTEFKQKNALQSAFGKYVNPTLARQIAKTWNRQLKLGGEKREVTVLFTDICHFTTISEKLKPESLVALLNEYFEAMSAVIMAEGGTVDKFEGDAIMAFFGAPVGQPDHALRAARAAINMRIKLNELLASWKSPGQSTLPGGEPKPSIDFRCGLSSGEVIVGNIGSSSRFNYTVMGDIVNLGSRLEGANKKYTTHIMMSEKTHTAIRDQFETRELDVIQVVGKTEPIKIFELLAPKGQLPAEAITLLQQYGEAMALYHNRQFADALAKFSEILKSYPGDGPTQLYRQRCEVLRDFPPKEDWNGVFEMGSK
ncbi:MAG: adenylate/guanylate cyclase domain-containing protein [Candidatus Gracilibacteria bacterium]